MSNNIDFCHLTKTLMMTVGDRTHTFSENDDGTLCYQIVTEEGEFITGMDVDISTIADLLEDLAVSVNTTNAGGLRFNNPWMRLEEDENGKFIRSDNERFRVTFVSDDPNAVNDHCRDHDDRGVICEDQHGNVYVALFECLS